MEGNDLVTLFLGGGGLGAIWAMLRWYLKERMQNELERRAWEREVDKRRDELRMRMLEHEQHAMNEVFGRFGRLSDRMADLIFELALKQQPEGEAPLERLAGGDATAAHRADGDNERSARHA